MKSSGEHQTRLPSPDNRRARGADPNRTPLFSGEITILANALEMAPYERIESLNRELSALIDLEVGADEVGHLLGAIEE